MTDIEPALTTPTMRLDGKIAMVTGAGRGLGRACALALAQAGAEVALVSRTLSDLDILAGEIRDGGGKAIPVVCDVTDTKAIDTAIGGLPGLDILVNNAGINFPEPFTEVSEDHFDRIMALNVRAVFMVSQAATRRMIADGAGRADSTGRAGGKGGAIINISSQMGHVGAPLRTAYCSSKHAVEGMTKAMGAELATHNIRVNSIGPTFILTPMTKPFFDNQKFKDDTLGRIPLGKLGALEDIMGAVVFLASPAAAMITGTSLVVDGGWTAI